MTKINLRPCAAALMILLLALSFETKAEPENAANGEEGGLVEIRVHDDIQAATYKDGRKDHGWLFMVGAENYKPTGFSSSIDGLSFTDAYGNGLTMPSLQVGYKVNFNFGSLSVLGSYGGGGTSSANSGENRSIDIENTGVKIMVGLDTLWDEPYAVPYGAIGVYRFGIDEKAPDSQLSLSGQTDFGTQLTVGVLLQLNWIEEEDSKAARKDAGLQNTFLNLYLTKYGGTSKSSDPDTSSDWGLGGGLVLEF